MNQGKILKERYKIIKDLCRGVFGKTYIAKDRLGGDQSICVVKQLQPLITDLSILEEARRRFELEATVLHRLGKHDRIPRLLDYFEENQTFYLIREFIEGQDLSLEISSDRLWSEDRVISLLRDVLSILKFVHQYNVIHRDIKPERLLRRKSDGNLILIGFCAIHEIETLVLNSEGITCTSAIGTPGYMAIEHLEGKPRFNSDIYSLGMTAIQGLTGVTPFQLHHKQQIHEVSWRSRSRVGDKLAAILDKMVRFDFKDRYQSVDEVLNDLRNFSSLQDLQLESKRDLAVELESPSLQNLQLELKRDRVPELESASQGQLPFSPSPPKLLDLNVGFTPVSTRYEEAEIQRSTDRYLLEDRPKELTLNSTQNETLSISKPFQYSPEPEKVEKKSVKLRLILSGVLTIAVGLLGFFLWPSIRFAYWVNRCNRLIDFEQFTEGLNVCNRAIAIRPNNPKVLKYKGDALLSLGRYEAALVAYEKALHDRPDFYQAWNTRGQVLYRLQRYQAALESHDKALAIAPEESTGIKGRGIALIGMGDYRGSLAAFEEAIVMKIDDWQAWEYKGLALEYLQEIPQARAAYNEAIAILENQIDKQLDEALAWVDRGRILGKLQRQEDALASYEKAIEINPDFYRAWIGKGSALFFLQRYEEALTAYKKVTEINPDYHLSWHNQGSMLADGFGQYEEAIASYDRAIELNPSFYPAWRDRGGALMKLEEYNRAIASFDEALKISPDDYQSWGNRGIALVQLERYDEALAAFDKALSINPEDPLAWANQGWALEKANRVTEAIAAYDKAIEIKPDFQPAIAARQKLLEMRPTNQ